MALRYPLAQLIRSRGVRRKALALRPIIPPVALGSRLARVGLGVVKSWERYVIERLLPAYEAALSALTQDAPADDVAAVIELAQRTLERLPDDELAAWASQVENWHGSRFISAVKDATGLDIELLLNRTGSADAVATFQRWASSLIRDINQQMRRRIESAVFSALASQQSRRNLAKSIAEIASISRARALRIARDQTLKLSAKLDEIRQQEAGIDSYRWVHSGKAHPRLHHLARDGKIFRWDEPPEDGHPRTQPNCGCTAAAWVDLSAD